MPPAGGIFLSVKLLLVAFALLVCNAAAGLASRLAGGLALAATAVLSTVAQIASLDGLNMFHGFTFHIKISILSLAQCRLGVNPIFHPVFPHIPVARSCDPSRQSKYRNHGSDNIDGNDIGLDLITVSSPSSR